MKHLGIIFLCLTFSLRAISQINIEMANRAAYLNNKASELLNAGQYLEAEIHLNKAIEYDSTLRSAYINLHESYINQNKLDSAIANLCKAVSVFTDDDELWYYLGNAHNKAGKFEAAIEAYHKAIELNKINGEDFCLTWAYYFNKANCQAQLKQYDKAITNYSQALSFQPENANIFFNRGMCHLMCKNKMAAKADWIEAQKLGMTEARQYIIKHCR
ncbi:MAG: tetratricopeptide repeat protein [Marinilabiliaceae bacterium]|nr:tetratricopeptide repeat protein [Marinilabiliaceae bacterium]